MYVVVRLESWRVIGQCRWKVFVQYNHLEGERECSCA